MSINLEGQAKDANTVPEVLIVGSGPSGLILALSLLKNGVPVRVIEKNTSWRVGQRGAGISPRSLELLESLGVVDQILARAVDVPMIRFYKMPEGTETLKEMSPTPNLDPTPSCPYRNFVVFGQDNLEAVLRTEMAKFGCTVELGTELTSLVQLEDRMQATIHRRSLDADADKPPVAEVEFFKWVIGADGARGTVRKQLGLPFIGETTGENFVIGDVKIEEGLDPDRWHMWGGITDVLAAIRPTETPGLFSFMLGGANLSSQDTICASDESLKVYIKSVTGNRDDIKISEVVCKSPFKINIRMVENFRAGRVFVTGDAGHVHSMTGGQGMNTGIQDSYNLGWKLALVVKGLAPPPLLESYSAERVPVVSEMLNITTKLLQQTTADQNGRGWDRSGNINQLGVNYRRSAIVLDELEGPQRVAGVGHTYDAQSSSYKVEEGSAVRGGDRAPDAPGLVMLSISLTGPASTPTRLFRLFDPTKHTAIVFFPKVDYRPILDILGTKAALKGLVRVIVIKEAGTGAQNDQEKDDVEVFEDKDGHAHDAYKGKNGIFGIFVIRPDGIVGARVGDVSGLKRYFEGLGIYGLSQ